MAASVSLCDADDNKQTEIFRSCLMELLSQPESFSSKTNTAALQYMKTGDSFLASNIFTNSVSLLSDSAYLPCEGELVLH